MRFSALQRAEIAEIANCTVTRNGGRSFSALQRAEIAEMQKPSPSLRRPKRVSVLFNEPKLLKWLLNRRRHQTSTCFSALQRAEIAEIAEYGRYDALAAGVSVLFNEPKLLKWHHRQRRAGNGRGFSALQRAEIAEIHTPAGLSSASFEFQCSSTSRNC